MKKTHRILFSKYQALRDREEQIEELQDNLKQASK